MSFFNHEKIDSFCALTNIKIILASSKVESSCCRVCLLQQPELFHRLQEAWRRYHQSLDAKPEDLKDYFVRDRREMPADEEGDTDGKASSWRNLRSLAICW